MQVVLYARVRARVCVRALLAADAGMCCGRFHDNGTRDNTPGPGLLSLRPGFQLCHGSIAHRLLKEAPLKLESDFSSSEHLN